MSKLSKILELLLAAFLFSTPVTVDWSTIICNSPDRHPMGLTGTTCSCCGKWLGGRMVMVQLNPPKWVYEK